MRDAETAVRKIGRLLERGRCYGGPSVTLSVDYCQYRGRVVEALLLGATSLDHDFIWRHGAVRVH
jgi:hypothetical protein